MHRIRSTALAVSILASALLAPYTPASGAFDETDALPSAAEILDRAFEAMGGKDAVMGVTSARYRIEPEIDDVPLTYYFHEPDMLLTERRSPQRLIRTGYDGNTAWHEEVRPRSYRVNTTDPDAYAEQQRLHIAFHRIVPDYYEAIERAEVLGRGELEGVDTYRVRFDMSGLHGHADRAEDETNTPTVIRHDVAHFNVEDGLLVAIEYAYGTPEHPIRMLIRYREWKKVEEVRMFTQIAQGPPGSPPVIINITEIEFDTVTREQMKRPAAIGRIEQAWGAYGEEVFER